MAPGLDSESGLERQRAEVEAAFRQGWRPMGARKPCVLTECAYTEARKVLDHRGWTGLGKAAVDAVRGGARPGDPLPALQPLPYVDDVIDAEVIITGIDPQRRVAVLFSRRDFPDTRRALRPLGRRPGGRPVLFEIKAEQHLGWRARASCGLQANA